MALFFWLKLMSSPLVLETCREIVTYKCFNLLRKIPTHNTKLEKKTFFCAETENIDIVYLDYFWISIDRRKMETEQTHIDVRY